MGIRIVIAAPQPSYAAKVALYLKEAETGWEVAVFTQIIALRMYLQDKPFFEALFIHPDMLQQVQGSLPSQATVIMLDPSFEEKDWNGPSLKQFQPLPRLVADIRRLMSGVKKEWPAGTALWTVYSASGGAGKTALSLNLVRQAEERGLRAFYLNLEAINATDLLLGGEEPDSFTRLLYDLQSNREAASKRLLKLAEKHSVIGGAFIDAPDHPGERLALTTERLRELVEFIRAEGGYDVIIADSDCGCGDWHQALLAMSGEILWVATEDAQSLHKTAKLAGDLATKLPEYPSNVTFILNKRIGESTVNWRAPGGVRVLSLPYIAQWKNLDSMTPLLQSPAFAGAVDKLLDHLGCSSQGGSGSDNELGNGSLAEARMDYAWKP